MVYSFRNAAGEPLLCRFYGIKKIIAPFWRGVPFFFATKLFLFFESAEKALNHLEKNGTFFCFFLIRKNFPTGYFTMEKE